MQCQSCSAVDKAILRQVMQMYGPDEEEAADVKVNRTSLSGWCAAKLHAYGVWCLQEHNEPRIEP